MKAAVVFDLAEGPVWADFIDPQPAPGQTLIDVRAAAISHVVKARASGRHYSFDGNLPFVPGIDGVGTTPQGQRVYFAFPTAPFGSMAQRAPVSWRYRLPAIWGRKKSLQPGAMRSRSRRWTPMSVFS